MKKMFLLCCSLAFAATLQAQVTHVPADYSTIQKAIDAANPGDTIFVTTGRYYEQINFKGKKQLVVTSQFLFDGNTGHISNTIIDGSRITKKDSASVVYFTSGEDTTTVLCGLTITGGKGTITNNNGWNHNLAGGGILISSSGATIRNNIISGNQCKNLTTSGLNTVGGGIASGWEQEENWIIIENNIIENNAAITNFSDGWSWGGGLCINNNCRMINNTIRNNVVKGLIKTSGWAHGAGAFIGSETYQNRYAVIKNNLFSNNSANANQAYSGGLEVIGMLLNCFDNTFIGNSAESDLNITSVGAGGMGASNCIRGTVISGNIFKQNYSEGFGGGLQIESKRIGQEYILVKNNYFLNNAARDLGGAFYTAGCPVIMQNNVFSRNHSDRNGGAIYLNRNVTSSHHLVTLINNSFFGNTSTSYGGAVFSDGAKPLIINSIFYADSSKYGSEIYLNGNDELEIGYSAINTHLITGTIVEGEGNMNEDPRYADASTLVLPPTSICIDKGTTFYTCDCGESWCCPCKDIMGTDRLTRVDMGAYEFNTVGIDDKRSQISGFAITNYPNPLKESTTFTYTLAESAKTKLSVFNSIGLLVAEPLDEFQLNGEHKVVWNASDLPAGIYYCRLQAGNQTNSVKIVKMK